MKLNFKYKVPFFDDEEATNIATVRSAIEAILDSKTIPASTKAAMFEDLTTRYRNYIAALDTPPIVQITKPDLGIVALPSSTRTLQRFSKLYDALQQNDKEEAIINNAPIVGSNINDLLKFAASQLKTAKKPIGYDEFFEFAKSYALIRPPKEKPLETPKKMKVKTIPVVKTESPKFKIKQELPSEDEDFSTPKTSLRQPIRKSARISNRSGRGKSLVIRLWKLQ